MINTTVINAVINLHQSCMNMAVNYIKEGILPLVTYSGIRRILGLPIYTTDERMFDCTPMVNAFVPFQTINEWYDAVYPELNRMVEDGIFTIEELFGTNVVAV